MFTLNRNKASRIITKFACAVLLVIAGALPSASQVEQLHQDCSALSSPGHYPDYEPAPSYSIVKREYDASKPPALLLRLSIPTEAFGGAAIVRLGCKLISDFPQERAVQALIFDEKDSARKLAPGFTDQAHYGTYLWHLRGHFELNRETNQAFVEFLIPELQDGLPNLRRVKYWLSSDLVKPEAAH